MKLNEPTNGSKHCIFLPSTIETLLKDFNDEMLPFEVISDLYLKTFECKLSNKEIHNEIMKVVKFNNLELSVYFTPNSDISLAILNTRRSLPVDF